MLKRFLKSPSPRITSDQALLIAQHECALRGWTWLEPVKITASRGAWHIITNATGRGVNARLVIDQNSGTVTRAAYVPR